MADLKAITEKDMCRETEIVGGHEFICILRFHGREFNNDGTQNPWKDSRGAPSKWRRHWMVRRYPEGEH